ncbi:hypothetical protein ACHAP7_009216 [Fusarium lateritium]
MADLVDLSLATRPGDIDTVAGLIKQLSELQTGLENGGENARHDMLVKARNLVHSLQTPREIMIQHTWADPGLNAVLITGVDVGLWKLMVKNGVDKPQRVNSLSKSLNVDPVLLGGLHRGIRRPRLMFHNFRTFYYAMLLRWVTWKK